MPYSLSMDLQQKPQQSLKQMQRLIMSRQMQQAIHLLQVPVMELGQIVDQELEENPILEQMEEEDDSSNDDAAMQDSEEPVEDETIENKEVSFDERDFEILRRLDEEYRDHFAESGSAPVVRSNEQDKLQTFLESSICAQPTLFEHLMVQAKESFLEEKERNLGEALIGNFDEGGFLQASLAELAVLHDSSEAALEKILEVIQTFHPAGIGARDLKECLLIQLRLLGKEKTLAYAIIEKHFQDLLHNHIPNIVKGLGCKMDQVQEAIDQHIVHLDLHPGTQLSRQVPQYIAADVSLQLEGGELSVAVSEDSLPPLRLNGKYLRMLDDDKLDQETKEFIQKKILSAKWLLRNIMQRNDTLEKIANVLAQRQKEFFLDPVGKLVPLTMKMVAEELELHESTIARAVSNKYIDTPRGLLPLRFFFTTGLATEAGGEISAKTVKDVLEEIISQEDSCHPLSDEAISVLLKSKGIHCARRTVAKYRTALNLGTAQQRRKF